MLAISQKQGDIFSVGSARVELRQVIAGSLESKPGLGDGVPATIQVALHSQDGVEPWLLWLPERSTFCWGRASITLLRVSAFCKVRIAIAAPPEIIVLRPGVLRHPREADRKAG